jgi:hypothetical protein
MDRSVPVVAERAKLPKLPMGGAGGGGGGGRRRRSKTVYVYM